MFFANVSKNNKITTGGGQNNTDVIHQNSNIPPLLQNEVGGKSSKGK